MPYKSLVFILTGTLAVTLAAGCSKGTDRTSQSSTQESPSAPLGDVAHGKRIYAANCAACHGPTGSEGGIGPSLKGEKARKNFDAAIAQIRDPKPPMPKLWPDPLNDKDVADVAAYVESL
jgi:mono/diheme cytochrome c family protein